MAKYTLKEAFIKEFFADKTSFTHDFGDVSDEEAEKAVDVLGTSKGEETGAHGPLGIHRASEEEIEAAAAGGDIEGLKEGEKEGLKECGCIEECDCNEGCGCNGDTEPMGDTALPHDDEALDPSGIVVIKLGHHEDGLNMGGKPPVEFGPPGGPNLDEEGYMAREEDDSELVAKPISVMQEGTQTTSRWQELAGIKNIKEELDPKIFDKDKDEEEEEEDGSVPLDPESFKEELDPKIFDKDKDEEEEEEDGSVPLDPESFKEESMLGATGGPSREGSVLETKSEDPMDDFDLDHLKDDDPDAMVDIGDDDELYSQADEDALISDLLGGIAEAHDFKESKDEDEEKFKAMEDEEEGRDEVKGRDPKGS